MPAVLEERPFGGFFMFFAVSDSEIFYVTFWNLFNLSYQRLFPDPLSSKTAGITGRR
nr:MAG TPA: hypothetical protein [Caudoviricetes sp.]